MRQSGSRVLQGHGAGQSKTFLCADIRGHAQPTDRWTGGNVVDYENAFQLTTRLMDVNDFGGTQPVGKGKRICHFLIFSTRASQTTLIVGP